MSKTLFHMFIFSYSLPCEQPVGNDTDLSLMSLQFSITH